MYRLILFVFAAILACSACTTASKTSAPAASKQFDVIAYYNGDGADIDQYNWAQLTQVIFSFCHLRGNELAVDNPGDSLTIRKLVALKQQHPQLKVLLSLGGWGGCKPCSEVFSTAANREVFAQSVQQLLTVYGADGIDLDWEYPAIEGYPGHAFTPADRTHFTQLIEVLRRKLGKKAEISFAAGGFKQYFEQSVDWKKVMPLVNRVNLMSYDLVHGYSTVTGHHTPLFSTLEQEGSVDFGVRYLKNLGVPPEKIVIGAAFYARTWIVEAVDKNGLYQTGKFKSFVPYKNFSGQLNAENGFVFYRDEAAQAPYAFSLSRKEYATFDDPKSLSMKTKYAVAKGLGGIMFWELQGDQRGVLLQSIWDASPMARPR
jgi:chitinase